MSALTNLITGGIASIVNSIADVVDRFVTTDDEKLKAKLELTKIAVEQERTIISALAAQEAELTERLKADMSSDSFLSKNIRPMSLIFLLGVFTVLALTDGNLSYGSWHFVIGQHYVLAFQSFTETMIAFYAGGRTIEKGIDMVSRAYKARG
jgi:hypothetical protein